MHAELWGVFEYMETIELILCAPDSPPNWQKVGGQ